MPVFHTLCRTCRPVEGLAVWDDPALRAEQGTWPVVSLSFSGAKGASLDEIVARMCERVSQA